ncbi:U3-containing 90S pre-ribosomal complex subunit-domain containing protein [Jimgerdemannia flammicorona]|uniref:U3-containing 90S pre-ribosomal complex subunit-domain containing protein n=1 Tax=Jimgerdemannia flammicorona TaxID=994334 RepID=A0A433PRB5_9FUNG|nr:U3-containing 90S pre-ribosomal complex subunit-domain containing protein [Jimgerdemannia flammicorona]
MSKRQSGDALEDDFALDLTVFAESGDEDDVANNDAGGNEAADPRSSKKRKTDGKSPKKKKKSHIVENVDITSLDRASQCEYIWEVQKKAIPSLSTMELEERRVPEDAFLDTKPFASPHTINNFASFIKFGVTSYKKKLVVKPSDDIQRGAPVVLILTSSAIRAVDVIRAMTEFQKQAKVAKLFAKHLKLEEQIAFLNNTIVNVAVGTPARVMKLIEESGALKLDRLELVVVDCDKDKKEFTIFDLLEVREYLFKFLGTHFVRGAKGGGVRLALY